MSRDPRDIVREGYDALAPRYLEFRLAKPGADLELLDEALADLPHGARMLDAGCGAGSPVAGRLAEGAGFAVDWVRAVTEGQRFGGSTHPFVRAHRL